MIDTHCHLTFPEFSGEKAASTGGVGAVLARAQEHGVTGCITIATTTRDSAAALGVARAHPRVWCSAGVHPCYADQGPHDWDAMRACGRDPKCVAWGELGLDNHYEDPPKSVQRAVLEEQLAHIQAWHAEAARTGERHMVKPVIVHCREAFADLIPILSRTSLDPSRFVFHCFTGESADMSRILDFGASVSFTGVVTYQNAPELRKAALLPPRARIMVETDAPFLSPHPHRGVRPCEPWMTSVTARALAQLRGEAWEEFHEAINANTRAFFGVEAT